MRPVIIIAFNDLLLATKERLTFLVGLLMPALMMLLLGIAIRGEGDASIFIDVIDEDGSDLSQKLVSILAADEDDTFEICPYTGDPPGGCDLPDGIGGDPGDWRATADDRLEKTDTYGVIIIEPGFDEKLRAGEPVTVTFKNSSELSAPTLAEQKIQAAVSRMGGAVAIANLTVTVAGESFGGLETGSAARKAAFGSALAAADRAWEHQPVTLEESETRERNQAVGFNQSGPGIAVMFVLMFMLNASTSLVAEREIGTLQRLYTLPVRKWQTIAGKMLGQYLFGVIQFVVLIGVGALMGVEWGDNVIGIGLLVLVFTLTGASLGLALATVVRTSAQANNISMLMGLTLAPLGGAWWPLEIVPDFMKMIGHISPIAWAMDAFNEMMFYDGGVIDILPMLGVLLGMAAIFFAFGAFNFRYE